MATLVLELLTNGVSDASSDGQSTHTANRAAIGANIEVENGTGN